MGAIEDCRSRFIRLSSQKYTSNLNVKSICVQYRSPLGVLYRQYQKRDHLFFEASSSLSDLSFPDRNWRDGLFVTYLFDEDVNLAKFGRSCPKTIQRPTENLNSVTFRRVFVPSVASVHWNAIFLRHGRLTWPRYSIDFVKNVQSFSFTVASSSRKDVTTGLIWSIFSGAQREETTILSREFSTHCRWNAQSATSIVFRTYPQSPEIQMAWAQSNKFCGIRWSLFRLNLWFRSQLASFHCLDLA